MSGRLAAGLLLAVVSACAINWGFFVQHDVAAGLPALSIRRPLRSVRALFGNARWLAGYAAGVTGWGLYIVALAVAPLSLVQAAAGGGIGVLAVLVFRSKRMAPSRREIAGITAAMTGLVLLGASLAGRTQHAAAVSSGTIAVWIALSLVAAASLAGAGARLAARGAALGAASGILYAAGDVATKAGFASHHYVVFFVAMAALHGLGFVVLQRGFQLGSALQTAGISSLLMNALPIAAGIVLFHDGVPSGFLGILRSVSFACVVAAAVLLARGDVTAPQPGIGRSGKSSTRRADRLAGV